MFHILNDWQLVLWMRAWGVPGNNNTLLVYRKTKDKKQRKTCLFVDWVLFSAKKGLVRVE